MEYTAPLFYTVEQAENYRTAPAIFHVLSNTSSRSEILCVIREGKNRQIRKMFEAVGYYDRIPVIVTCRPELRNEESFVNDVLEKISNFNKC